ncbi:hypothetical protein L2E82_39024 [Cichorium intybus]|uniref:Uncharacterized protein n=1 Tax=Cichorium intybus TaxID=13427 RepID=A0ACB9AGV2_CICIN|nr:hypothetical protein L2E82_39024 [Cichorium intybus]
MQALALKPEGSPTFRLTRIGPPLGDNTDHLQEVGWKLAQLADTIHVEFEYSGFLAESLADLEPTMLDLREDEVVAVNSGHFCKIKNRTIKFIGFLTLIFCLPPSLSLPTGERKLLPQSLSLAIYPKKTLSFIHQD